MKTIFALIFVAGLASSAVLDNRVKKTEWDDEDSMTLSSPKSPSVSDNTNAQKKETEEIIKDEPQSPFISFLPMENQKEPETELTAPKSPSVSDSNNDKKEEVADEIQKDTSESPFISFLPMQNQQEPETELTAPKAESQPENTYQNEPIIISEYRDGLPSNSQEEQQNQQDQSKYVTVSSTSSEESSETSTEKPSEKLGVVQLSKIPLTFEIISLFQPDKERQPRQNPVPFFPEEEKIKVLRQEQPSAPASDEVEEQQQSSTPDSYSVALNNRGDSGIQQVPDAPLNYMVPPKMDEESFWRKYPMPSSSPASEEANVNDDEQVDSTSVSSDSEPQMISTTTEADESLPEIPPQLAFMLERYIALQAQKTKRHSTTDENEGEVQQQMGQTTESAEEDPTTLSTPSEEEESDFQMTTFAPPPPAQPLWHQIQLPSPGQPETVDYTPEAQPLPYRSATPPMMNQYFSNYPAVESKPYRNPSPFMMPPQPRKPIYIPSEYSSWSSRRNLPLDNSIDVGHHINSFEMNDYPFMRNNYDDYYLPRRPSRRIPYNSPIMNSIMQDSIPESPIGYGYGSDNGLASYYFGRNNNYRSRPNYFSFPNPYELNNQSPLIRYRPTYDSYSSSPIVPMMNSPVMNSLMYAPKYSYQMYRREQPEFYY